MQITESARSDFGGPQRFTFPFRPWRAIRHSSFVISRSSFVIRHSLVTAFLSGALATAAESSSLLLLTNAQVDSEGIFLSQVVAPDLLPALPQIRLADAPGFGQAVTLTRTQIFEVMQKTAPELVPSHWAGSERVRITRRSRILNEAELKEQLTALLQRDQVKDKGELELRLVRPWLPMLVPDEPYALKILDLPTTGVSPSFLVRFELSTRRETLGRWQAALQARVWREVWVARAALRRDQLFSEADVGSERRDVLTAREALLPSTLPAATLEIAESVPAGVPLYLRSVRVRPVVRRGQVVDAQFQEGAMMISLKVEVMESGAPGQMVRVRNAQSKREFRGKVQNEQTIVVSL
jgi:flagella basal body P-ring formation protein FlgA